MRQSDRRRFFVNAGSANARDSGVTAPGTEASSGNKIPNMTSPPKTHKRRKWRVIDHTADLRIEARGESLPELFLNCAQALTVLLVGRVKVAPTESRELTLSAPSIEDLLVEWLRELLFDHQVHGRVFVNAEVLDLSDTLLKARAAFGKVPEGHSMQCEIKAVTYHGLKIVRRGDAYVVRIIFDI
uniref:Archease n=1 Tax=Desulfomonile tiedjei TaxID=2358 RepID=A0A7C4ASG3_9BACT